MIQDKQQALVRRHLRQHGLKNKELLAEMTDHYLTEIELEMERGSSFEEALSTCLNLHHDLDMKQLNKSIFFIHHQHKIIMTIMSLMFMTCLTFMNLTPDQPPIANVEPILLEVEAVIMDPPSIWPVSTRQISSGFGMRMHPELKEKRFHRGVDIRADFGTPVVASEDGVVIEASYGNKKGYYVEIQHDETYTTRYWHLQEYMVKVGQKVSRGEVIAKVGSSGYSTGPHLHYEVIKDGKAVDPGDYLGQ